MVAVHTLGPDVDARYMARALFLAERGRGRTSPNPMVGAVVVNSEGVVVGRGSHEFAGGPHAEVHALRDAGDRARGATLYCTLEPCSHSGRTGPCAPLVADAGIRRVVVACEDPNPKVSGRGLNHLRARGIDVTLGVLSREAEALNRDFFTVMRMGRPFVTLKAALSLDGCVAAAPGQRTPLTGAASARAIHRERAEVDALGIGSETMLVDDPVLTARVAYRHRPLVRVIFDRRLRTPETASILATLDHGPVIVLASPDPRFAARADALARAGARIEAVEAEAGDSAAFLSAAMRRLVALGVNSILIEGGPTLHRAFWEASLVDRMELFIAPMNVGPAGVRWRSLPDGVLASLNGLRAVPVGDDVRVEGDVHRTH
jgi:diaminohydroxyphosphoribosylaminopyrimidine deaminase / 5-amino-6-(5-phosphoribosylamino)uracil reductase